MPGRTGSEWAYFQRNRLVRNEDLADHFMQYWQSVLEDLIAPLWAYAGLFEPVTLAGDGADKFKLNSYAAQAGVARQEFLRPGENLAYIEGVQFENTVGVHVYHIGLRPTFIGSELVVNPKDGTPQWTLIKHMIGLEGNPDSVVDNLDGTLTMIVDSITEAAVSNAGRKVQVYQFTPSKGATSYAIATQICTVAWDGSNNKITTVDAGSVEGYLGQTTPSTTAGDYTVVLLGPHVSRNTDLSLDQDYAYLGTVKGAGAGNPPTVFDTSGQIVFGSSTISNLWHITRTENVPPNRLKIDVKAIAAEEGSNIDQIRVSGWDGIGGAKTVFSVDELGNVTIEGDLTVEGETTQEDLVTVNASEIVTDSLTLGDHDTNDSHLIKGIWAHKDATETDTWFVVDGAQSGHVGIGVAADATYSLHVAGGAKVGGSLVPGTGTKEVGDIANRWSNFWGTGVDVTSECKASQFYANRSNGPRYDFDRTDASAPNDQQHFRIGSMSNGVLSFQSADDGWSSFYDFMIATKGAATEDIASLALDCTTLLSLNCDTAIGIDAGSANVVIQAGGIVSITAPLECGDKFKVSDAAGEGVNGNFSPSAIQSFSLGNWDVATDTGYRWAGVFSADFFAVSESDEPGYHWRNHSAAADEKHWTFYIDSGNDLLLQTREDNPIAAGSGVDILKVTRGAGTAVTRIDIYKPTYMGATLFSNAIAPTAGSTYEVGAYGGSEYLGVTAKDIVAADNAPRIVLREKDQIGTGIDRENWGIIATGGDLAIVAYNSARTLATEAIHITRTAGNSYAIDSIDFPVAIRTTTYPLIAKGSTGNTFKSDLYSLESGLGADEGRWRWTTTDDGNGHLKLVTVTDAGGAGVDILRVIRSSGTGIGNIECYTNFVPATDSDTDLGAISPGNLRWQHGYINRPVIEKRTITNTGDAGTQGMITFDDNYIYCCIGANSWARVAIATW